MDDGGTAGDGARLDVGARGSSQLESAMPPKGGNIHVCGAATVGWVERRGEMLGEVFECSVDPHARSARGERRGRKENCSNTSVNLVEKFRCVIRLEM